MRKIPATSRGRRRHVVAAVIADGFAPFEFATACEVFGLDRSELDVPWYEFRVCAVGPGPVLASEGGFTVDAPYGLDAAEDADTIYVAPIARLDDPPAALLDLLRRAHRRGARIMSVCSGAFVLAAAGLLDGRRATTHWMFTDEMRARHPEVDLDPGVLYIDDGDVLTSAGTAAGIDLCLHVVRQDYGTEIANAVARRMVVPPHRDGGQAQYVDLPVPEPDHDLFGATLGWLAEHLDEQVTVDDLAARSAMSPRTFARRFKDTTGTTPYRWIVRQRVLRAQHLLEATDEPVERIAGLCGFGTAAAFRQQFQALVHTTPSAFRRTFRTEREPAGPVLLRSGHGSGG